MKPALVEGIDYYMENGKLVFTAAYHSRRGFCCNSRCRHCPWREDAPPEPKLVVLGLPANVKLPGR